MRTALLIRDIAMGDALFMEPVARAMARQGYKVYLKTSYPDLFANHPDIAEVNVNREYDIIHKLCSTYERYLDRPMVDSYLACCDLSLPECEKTPRLYLTEQEMKDGRSLLGDGRYVAMCCTTVAQDYWAGGKDETWARLIRAMQDRGRRVVLIEKEPPDLNRELQPDLDLRGKTTLRQCIAVLANCDFVLSPSNGICNLAQALDVRGVGIYRNNESPLLALRLDSGIVPYRPPHQFGTVEDHHIDTLLQLCDFWLQDPHGPPMYLDPEYRELVAEAAHGFGITSIVETGTHYGTGTTIPLAETGLPVATVECNIDNYKAASRNLQQYPNVTTWHGTSLPRDDTQDFVNQDVEFYRRASAYGLRTDVVPKAAPEFYAAEMRSEGEDALLPRLLQDDEPQLVVLDSAGGTGLPEFFEVAKHRNKLVIMDDVNHIKHYRSMKWCLAHRIPFHLAKSRRWGWCYIS